MLLIIKKVSEAEYVMLFVHMWNLMTNVWKIMIKIKNLHILIINNLYRWAMSERLLINNFKWVEETFQFNEDFIKSYNDDSDEEYFLETDVQCLENLQNLYNDLPDLFERTKIENIIKLIMLYT